MERETVHRDLRWGPREDEKQNGRLGGGVPPGLIGLSELIRVRRRRSSLEGRFKGFHGSQEFPLRVYEWPPSVNYLITAGGI